MKNNAYIRINDYRENMAHLGIFSRNLTGVGNTGNVTDFLLPHSQKSDASSTSPKGEMSVSRLERNKNPAVSVNLMSYTINLREW